jgi:rhodanese-related sulfurtransferase
MDGKYVSSQQLYAGLGSASAPFVVDVRHDDAFNADDAMIIGAVCRAPEAVRRWRNELPKDRKIVVYCVHGDDISQNTAGLLRKAGIEVAYLEGGITDWIAHNFPTRRKRDASENKWITREHPKIDRIACPWLISRFVNPDADFIYVPANAVAKVAADVGGTPYDVDGVEFGHVGEYCSFDAIVRAYDIHDAALDRLATIVRGADTSRHELAAQCGGLVAISLGLSANFPDDQEMLAHGMVIYDGLYTWCRSLRQEIHTRPTKTATRA